MVVSLEEIAKNYPLHHLIWHNGLEEIQKKETDSGKTFVLTHLETKDPRGRTPLALAIIKGYVEIVEYLLQKHNADCLATNEAGWSIVHEAVGRGDPDILRMVLIKRDMQKAELQARLVPQYLETLNSCPDFFIEMKWEFTTWVPLLKRFLPSQVHRIYKSGSNLKIDSILNSAQNSDPVITLLIKAENSSVVVLEIDHSSKQSFSHHLVVTRDGYQLDASLAPYSQNGRLYLSRVAQKLTRPLIINQFNLDASALKRKKGLGVTVNGYQCKVFDCKNFKIISKVRLDHLSELDKKRIREEPKKRTFFNFREFEAESDQTTTNPVPVDEIKYFDPNEELERGSDVGPPKENVKINAFNATVWVSENYPISLDSVIPIIDIMGLTNSQFHSLKDFIRQIPSFPVKLEVPIYHLVNASISFHNIFGRDKEVPGVTCAQDQETNNLVCKIDQELFTPPPYPTIESCFVGTVDDDDLFSMFRDQDDGANAGSGGGDSPPVDIYEALNAPRSLIISPDDADAEEQLLQRAIEESLIYEKMKSSPGWRPESGSFELLDEDDEDSSNGDGSSLKGAGIGSLIPVYDLASASTASSSSATTVQPIHSSTSFDDLQTAIQLSKQECEDSERIQKEEAETLQRILRLSLLEY